MARKKVVLVIVEGPSDDTALGVMLNQIYRVYYMSCNLDHVPHNRRNSTDDEKETEAFIDDAE